MGWSLHLAAARPPEQLIGDDGERYLSTLHSPDGCSPHDGVLVARSQGRALDLSRGHRSVVDDQGLNRRWFCHQVRSF